jgi:hypothetical protein
MERWEYHRRHAQTSNILQDYIYGYAVVAIEATQALLTAVPTPLAATI